MKKTNNGNIIKKLTTIIFCLIAIMCIVIGFIGIYFPIQGKSVNLVPEFSLGTDLNGVMEYRFLPDDTEEEKNVYVDKNGNIKGEVMETASEELEENLDIPYNIEKRNIKANEDKVLIKENFEKAKEIIEKRFKKFGIIDYAIRMDNVTGNFVVELSRNNERDWSTILFGGEQVHLNKPLYMFDGNFRIKDYQTGVELLDNSHIKNVYSEAKPVSEMGYVVFLQIELTEEGCNLLNDISNKYIEYTGADGNQKRDYVDILLDDFTFTTTYFPNDYEAQILSIPVSPELTDNTLIKDYAETANMLAEIINIGELPVSYEISSQLFIKTLTSENFIKLAFIIMYIILGVISIVFIIKFKLTGLVAAILNAGFIALVIIILRLLEVTILINSLISLILVIALNTMFLWIYLATKKDEEGFLEAFKKYYAIIIPVIIISFVFTFSSNEMIAGIGNILFWALLVQVIYNFVFTRFSIND